MDLFSVSKFSWCLFNFAGLDAKPLVLFFFSVAIRKVCLEWGWDPYRCVSPRPNPHIRLDSHIDFCLGK